MTTTTLKHYGLIVRARWRWVAWGMISAVAATAAVLLLWPPLYRSEAVVFVRTPGRCQPVRGRRGHVRPDRAETYSALAKSAAISARVIADTGLDQSPQTFAGRVTARHLGGTALLQIAVGAASPDEARRAAQALLTELNAEVRTLEAVPGSLIPRAELIVVDPPSRPSRVIAGGAPLYPFVIGPVFIGAFLGALAGGNSRHDNRCRGSRFLADRRTPRQLSFGTQFDHPGGFVNLREFFDTARLYSKTFAAAALTVAILGIGWLLLSPLQYVSTAQLLVSVNGTSTANAYQNDNVVAGRVNSYVALLTSEVVSQRVVDKLGLKMSPGELATKVSAVRVPPNTAIIDIAVTDPSAEQARRIAGTVADEFVAYTQALESPTGVDAQKVQTSVVSQASQPRSRLAERIAIGGLIGVLALLAGAVAVWIRAATDQVVRTPSQARNATDLPVLAVADSGDASSPDALDPTAGCAPH